MNHEHDAKSETIHARNNNKKVEKKKNENCLIFDDLLVVQSMKLRSSKFQE